jgi:hypothetical protein
MQDLDLAPLNSIQELKVPTAFLILKTPPRADDTDDDDEPMLSAAHMFFVSPYIYMYLLLPSIQVKSL